MSLSTTIRVPMRFTASHSLAVREELHPHEYTVVLELTGPVDPNSGFVVDMGEVRNLLEPLVQQLDGTTLNNNQALIAAGPEGAMAARFPTCECLAAYFAAALKLPVAECCGAARLTAVEVILGDDSNPGAEFGHAVLRLAETSEITDPAIQALASQLVERLKLTSQTVATAESCTGGMLAAAITSVPGSSAVFGYGFVTYSYPAKQQLIGVPDWILAEDGPGAVSLECVEAMAEGALRASDADIAIAVSGIAGPDGGTPDKPVGTVWFSVARRLDDGAFTVCALETFTNQGLTGTALRNSIRQQATKFGLKILLDAVCSD